jgi:sugar phosphate isomerase/epimerase
LSAAGKTASKVQVGYCAQLKEIAAAKAAGFDYLELRVAEVAALSDEEFEKLLAQVKQLNISVPAANVFIPPAIKLTGSAIDKDQQMTYVRKAFDRLTRLGVQVVIFGSGGARTVPEGFSKTEAFNQLVEFGKHIAPEARARRLTILVEPLRKQECNIINTAGEGLKLVEAVNHPNFQLMVDFYHLAEEKENPAIIIKARTHIRHLHMANPQGRVFPLKWEEFDYAQFFKNLRRIGYNKRISVEASSKDFASEAPQAIALLRRAFSDK